ncbi:MAG: hypothetical protein HZC45_02200 [Deltaproteobacteria bacterium]|nr:hypothetical protein [Deltaproteobacteria bacterium]
MPTYNDTPLVNSKEILEQTGISRATLNNYIKLGIIPKPDVKKAEDHKTRARKIGYFPKTVLDRIELVKQMKKEGNSMEDIIDRFNKTKLSSAIGNPPVSNGENSENKTKDVNYIGCNEDLKVTIKDIHCPAYLVNNNFEVSWTNSEAENEIFNQNIHLIRNAGARNIFKLLMKLDSVNKNKNELIDFHMSLFKSRYSRDILPNLYNNISESEIQTLEKSYDKVSVKDCVINETYTNLIGSDGILTSYHVFYIIFREGIFLVYAHDKMHTDILYLLSNRRNIINELLKQCIPSLISFCAIVADLQDSSRICAELPPEEYFELINEIRRYMESSFKKYNGVCGKHVGDGMVYYFLKDKNAKYLMNTIHCSLELRDEMKKLNLEWKRRKGWLNDLYLNIGINEGEEYFGTISDSSSIEFTALGDSVNCASRVSDFARYGAIWITKNLINRLSAEERKKIRFGIRRREQDREIFIENTFSRVMDMLKPDESNYKKYMDIATLPITEIVDMV